jgi:hypothetical protein
MLIAGGFDAGGSSELSRMPPRLDWYIPTKWISDLTLSNRWRTIRGVLEGSGVLREAGQKAEKWPLQALARVFTPALRGNGGGNIPRPAVGYPGAESFEPGGALWNAS